MIGLTKSLLKRLPLWQFVLLLFLGLWPMAIITLGSAEPVSSQSDLTNSLTQSALFQQTNGNPVTDVPSRAYLSLVDWDGNLLRSRLTPDVIYVSSDQDGSIGGVSAADEDILVYNNGGTGQWALYFDGSDMGATVNLNAFLVLTDSILMSFENPVTLPDVGQVVEQDIVRFVPTSTGQTTAGQFEWYFDGSDVALTGSTEGIDAFALTADERLLISTVGNGAVTGVPSFVSQDLIAFTPSQLGETTSGTWEMYFDGSDVNLTTSSENLTAAWLDSTTDDIYLSTLGAFSALDISGDGADIFICDPFSLGNTTICSFNMFWDGSEQGFPAGHSVDGVSLAVNTVTPTPTPSATSTNTPTNTPTPTPEVNMVVEPQSMTVDPNEILTMTVQVQAGSQQVDGASAYLDFDPTVLQVQQLTDGNVFQFVLQSDFDNQSGTIDFAAGAFSNLPSGTFDLVQIQFEAITQTTGTTL